MIGPSLTENRSNALFAWLSVLAALREMRDRSEGPYLKQGMGESIMFTLRFISDELGTPTLDIAYFKRDVHRQI